MIEPDYGRQYAKDDAFKARARLHQSRFRLEVLGLREYRDYGSRLTSDAALAGKNFCPWPGVLEAVEKRFGVRDKKLCWDMLASDHIPFNFFSPLCDQPWALDLVRGWVGAKATRLTGVHVEWAPKPAANFLDDNTSFDAYLTYDTADGGRGAIGIETKFTEGPYSWGVTERKRMFDDTSDYLGVTRASGLYVDGALEALRTAELKQLWRNQLLGEAMLQRGLIDEVASVLVYPADNTHYSSAARAYRRLLQPKHSARFVAVTFEEYFACCRTFCHLAGEVTAHATAWIDYLERRYLVA